MSNTFFMIMCVCVFVVVVVVRVGGGRRLQRCTPREELDNVIPINFFDVKIHGKCWEDDYINSQTAS